MEFLICSTILPLPSIIFRSSAYLYPLILPSIPPLPSYLLSPPLSPLPLQLTVYNHNGGPCYRCLFPSPPPPATVTNCSEGGVLGVGMHMHACTHTHTHIHMRAYIHTHTQTKKHVYTHKHTHTHTHTHTNKQTHIQFLASLGAYKLWRL